MTNPTLANLQADATSTPQKSTPRQSEILEAKEIMNNFNQKNTRLKLVIAVFFFPVVLYMLFAELNKKAVGLCYALMLGGLLLMPVDEGSRLAKIVLLFVFTIVAVVHAYFTIKKYQALSQLPYDAVMHKKENAGVRS